MLRKSQKVVCAWISLMLEKHRKNYPFDDSFEMNGTAYTGILGIRCEVEKENISYAKIG